jgi:hypothetical protein
MSFCSGVGTECNREFRRSHADETSRLSKVLQTCPARWLCGAAERFRSFAQINGLKSKRGSDTMGSEPNRPIKARWHAWALACRSVAENQNAARSNLGGASFNCLPTFTRRKAPGQANRVADALSAPQGGAEEAFRACLCWWCAISCRWHLFAVSHTTSSNHKKTSNTRAYSRNSGALRCRNLLPACMTS